MDLEASTLSKSPYITHSVSCQNQNSPTNFAEEPKVRQASCRRAPVDEVLSLTEKYRNQHRGWNAKHFHSWYQRNGGSRSYTWVKKELQKAGLVKKTAKRGAHRKKRDRMPLPGMMIHQDGSRHNERRHKRALLNVVLRRGGNQE